MFYLFECPSVIKKNKELTKSQRCILFSTLMRCICTLHDYLKKKKKNCLGWHGPSVPPRWKRKVGETGKRRENACALIDHHIPTITVALFLMQSALLEPTSCSSGFASDADSFSNHRC